MSGADLGFEDAGETLIGAREARANFWATPPKIDEPRPLNAAIACFWTGFRQQKAPFRLNFELLSGAWHIFMKEQVEDTVKC
jgi:hypothetical protein